MSKILRMGVKMKNDTTWWELRMFPSSITKYQRSFSSSCLEFPTWWTDFPTGGTKMYTYHLAVSFRNGNIIDSHSHCLMLDESVRSCNPSTYSVSQKTLHMDKSLHYFAQKSVLLKLATGSIWRHVTWQREAWQRTKIFAQQNKQEGNCVLIVVGNIW